MTAAAEPADLRSLWPLKPDVTYLNHGSFGACPHAVRQAAAVWSARLDAEPCEFFQRDSADLLERMRGILGRYLGASGADLLQVVNATFGGNIVATGWERVLKPGDEVLTTDHEYGAMVRMWQGVCGRTGAKLVMAKLPWPVRSPAEIADALFAARTTRTRLVFFSHVTSPTALILPAAEIVRRAHAAGLPVFIDGAHAPGMFPLDLDGLGADWYVGNCHKWMCAPVGSGFLHARADAVGRLANPVVGWGCRPGRAAEPLWQAEYEWMGTRDYAAFLATEAAIGFLEMLGPDRFRRHSRALVSYARKRITEVTGLEPPCPDTPELLGSMVSLPMPPGDRAELQNALWHRFRIEVPVVEWNGRRLLRVSAHLYNSEADIDRLAAALKELL